MARDDNPQYTHPDLWLDDDHFIEWLRHSDDNEPTGIVIWNRYPPNPVGWCNAIVHWRGDFPESRLWQLVSLNPLHIEPSILCHHCKAHGFIRDGRWVSA